MSSMQEDKLLINKDTLSLYCNTNEKLVKGRVKGVIAEFPGLGGSSCLGGSLCMGDYESSFAHRCAENGILLVYLFPGPWSWGNRTAVRISDLIMDAVADKFGLPKGFPLVICGGSMGGQSCFIYAAETRHTVTAVASACPCVDVVACFDAERSFPRSFISAVAEYDMPLCEGLKQISPVHRAESLPDISYFICSDGEDEFFPEQQIEAFADLLKSKKFDVTYLRQPGKRHGEFTPEVRQALNSYMIRHALNGAPEIARPQDPLAIEEVRRAGGGSLRVYFSKPVTIEGSPYMSIRFTRDGTGVCYAETDGSRKKLEFMGNIAPEDASQGIWLWTMLPDNEFHLCSVDQIMERAGDLYAYNNPIKFYTDYDRNARICSMDKTEELHGERYHDIH